MISQIKIRRGTTAEWAAAHPVVLAEGEPGYDTTLKLLKIGDGVTNWATLPFQKSDDSDKLDGNTLAQLKLLMYPVGAIYESTVSTSPASLFGGTWAAMGGTFLLGANGTYAAGATGGEATHTLTIYEMPSHAHNLSYGIDTSAPGQRVSVMASGNYISSSSIESNGSGQAHNNMPPYEVVYRWKRTA